MTNAVAISFGVCGLGIGHWAFTGHWSIGHWSLSLALLDGGRPGFAGSRLIGTITEGPLGLVPEELTRKNGTSICGVTIGLVVSKVASGGQPKGGATVFVSA